MISMDSSPAFSPCSPLNEVRSVFSYRVETRSKDIGRGRKLFVIYFRLNASAIFLVKSIRNRETGHEGLEAMSYNFVCSGFYKKV